MEVLATIRFEAHWLHLGEFVDSCENRRGCSTVSGCDPSDGGNNILGRLEDKLVVSYTSPGDVP